MPIVGSIITTTDSAEIPLNKGTDKKDIQFIFCNTQNVDDYLFLSWHKDDQIVQLYSNYPILANDTYPRDNTPFKITLGVRDKIFVRSVRGGIQVTMLK